MNKLIKTLLFLLAITFILPSCEIPVTDRGDGDDTTPTDSTIVDTTALDTIDSTIIVTQFFLVIDSNIVDSMYNYSKIIIDYPTDFDNPSQVTGLRKQEERVIFLDDYFEDKEVVDSFFKTDYMKYVELYQEYTKDTRTLLDLFKKDESDRKVANQLFANQYVLETMDFIGLVSDTLKVDSVIVLIK